MSSAGGGEGPTEHTGNTAMFAVFMLAIYSLGLFPYTLYRLCATDEQTAQPVVVSKAKKGGRKGAGPSLAERLTALLADRRTLLLLLAWAAWLALLFFAGRNAGDLAPFDPFAILGLDHGATDRDIKKAYRKLSLQYHPDKNPDPKAAAYFASHIAKAYAALTDPISRQNYEKYGHPDGPQGMNVGVALPEWMFNKDKRMAPLMLLGLIGGGVLLPMALGAWHLLKAQKYSGPNKIMNETFSYLWHSPFKVKELQSLPRIPETLICAHEFILLPCPPQQAAQIEDLRALVGPHYPEMTARGNKIFWGRKPGLVKAHLLVLAHMQGLGSRVPRELWEEYRYVIGKCPLLAEEIHRIALYPRAPLGCGWASPAVASVEVMQCLAQCISPADRRCAPSTKGGGPGDVAPLLQLPGFDAEAVKRLRRAKRVGGGGAVAAGGGAGAAGGAGGVGAPVAFAEAAPATGAGAVKAAKKLQQQAEQQQGLGLGGGGKGADLTVRDLQAMDEVSRSEALTAGAGLTPDEAEEAAAFLQVLPEVALTVSPPEVDGEEGVCPGDPVRLRAHALLRRPAHALPGYAVRGRAVRALRQHPPGLDAPPREEGWYAVLIDPATNSVFSACPGPRVNLVEAERAALARPDAFAAAAAAMARRCAAAPPAIQAISNVVVTPGGPSAVAAAWVAKCERRKKALEAKKAAAAAAAGAAEEGGAAAAAGGGKQQQQQQQQQRRAGGSSGGGGKEPGQDQDEHASLYEGYGQALDLGFMAPPEGTYNLLLLLLSDAYVGADVAVPVRLVVTKVAAREAAAAAAAAAADGESELTTALRGGEDEDDDVESDSAEEESDSDDDDDGEDDDSDGSEHSYDSEETGTMETGPESESGSGDDGDDDEGDGSNSE